MQTKWINKKIDYNGKQLCSHWVYNETGVIGDVIAAFAGATDVPVSNMADLVDVKNNEPIFSKFMLHFIVEHFEGGLSLAIARQNLLAAIVAEMINEREASFSVKRNGNDLFEGNKKLSVSIATVSPVSFLIHFGINIESHGTPVPTKGLSDYGIEPKEFAGAVMKKYSDEIMKMKIAGCKVRSVG